MPRAPIPDANSCCLLPAGFFLHLLVIYKNVLHCTGMTPRSFFYCTCMSLSYGENTSTSYCTSTTVQYSTSSVLKTTLVLLFATRATSTVLCAIFERFPPKRMVKYLVSVERRRTESCSRSVVVSESPLAFGMLPDRRTPCGNNVNYFIYLNFKPPYVESRELQFKIDIFLLVRIFIHCHIPSQSHRAISVVVRDHTANIINNNATSIGAAFGCEASDYLQ